MADNTQIKHFEKPNIDGTHPKHTTHILRDKIQLHKQR